MLGFCHESRLRSDGNVSVDANIDFYVDRCNVFVKFIHVLHVHVCDKMIPPVVSEF